MKKIILTAVFSTLCAISSLYAFSWSGVIDDNTKFSANHDFSELNLGQSNGIYLSANQNLNESGSLRLSGEILYKYKLNTDLKGGKPDFQNIIDIDLLKFAGGWTVKDGYLSLNAGRFKYVDYTATVFSQTSDGLYISYDSQKFKTSLYAGYTGLLNRLNVSMAENDSEENEQFYALCPMYIPVLADFSYKALFESHTIGLQLAGFIPLKEENTLTAYGTFILNGYFGKVASYDLRVTAGTEKFKSLMLDGKLDVNFYAGSNFMITAGGEYVSGAQGKISPFLTITNRSFGSAPVYNGVIVPKLSVLFAMDKFVATATERVIISIPEEKANLDGFDTTVNLLYNIFSDLQIGCDLGGYYCKENKEKSTLYAAVKAVLAF